MNKEPCNERKIITELIRDDLGGLKRIPLYKLTAEELEKLENELRMGARRIKS